MYKSIKEDNFFLRDLLILLLSESLLPIVAINACFLAKHLFQLEVSSRRRTAEMILGGN